MLTNYDEKLIIQEIGVNRNGSAPNEIFATCKYNKIDQF
jgi:hypothetical protein